MVERRPRRSGGRADDGRRRARKAEVVAEAEVVVEAEVPAEAAVPVGTKRSRRTSIPAGGVAAQMRLTEEYQFCHRLVGELLKHPDCKVFKAPVLDMWSQNDVPGYLDMIEKPMDLGTVMKNIRLNKYCTPDGNGDLVFHIADCFTDIRLVFQNCMTYNEPQSEFFVSAKSMLELVEARISNRAKGMMKRESTVQKPRRQPDNRKRRKTAEDEKSRRQAEAQIAESAAAAAAAAAERELAKVKKAAEDLEKRRATEQRKREKDMTAQMELEKKTAIDAAVREALARQQKDPARPGRLVNTSSISSDEHEMNGEVTFTFVSTAGMEKKRGRKSAVVMELEGRHEELMKRRRVMVETGLRLEKQKQIQVTYDEKAAICEQVGALDFVRMKAVVDIIARGMNRLDILNEVEVDLDIDNIDNSVLREVQCFLDNPAAVMSRGALQAVESELADIESDLISIRYNKAT